MRVSAFEVVSFSKFLSSAKDVRFLHHGKQELYLRIFII